MKFSSDLWLIFIIAVEINRINNNYIKIQDTFFFCKLYLFKKPVSRVPFRLPFFRSSELTHLVLPTWSPFHTDLGPSKVSMYMIHYACREIRRAKILQSESPSLLFYFFFSPTFDNNSRFLKYFDEYFCLKICMCNWKCQCKLFYPEFEDGL